MINHKSQGKGQIQVPKLTQPCSSLIGDIYQEKKHWKPDDSVRVVAIMLQIKARREHHAAAMLAHVESLATSCMQSSKANREIERRFAVARHEPKDVLWCDSTQIPTHPEKLASCSVLGHNSAQHLLPMYGAAHAFDHVRTIDVTKSVSLKKNDSVRVKISFKKC